MNGNRAFFDTNLIVYAYSDDDLYKKRRTISVMNDSYCVVSTQVLNEFCNVCIKKQHKTETEIVLSIGEIQATCDLFIVDADTVAHALEIHSRYHFSYYDCLIVASALESGCDYLFTEDLQDGQVIDGLTIRNIFMEELT
ncbi:MAG: PIN domain-containing protein [Treponema sp.]|jgi:predicted nucleic acid-binding protein|nr:PIN domain-containing protein [Treponema sp.]